MIGRRLFLGQLGTVVLGIVTAEAWGPALLHDSAAVIQPGQDGPFSLLSLIVAPTLDPNRTAPISLVVRRQAADTVLLHALLSPRSTFRWELPAQYCLVVPAGDALVVEADTADWSALCRDAHDGLFSLAQRRGVSGPDRVRLDV